MKLLFFLLLTLLFTKTGIWGQCPINPRASISGSTCLGSTLTASSSIPPSSIVWRLNGSTTVATESASLQGNGIVIAGGSAGSDPSQLMNPDRIFVTADGTIYIPDLSNSRVQKWTPGATTGITVAGGNGIGPASTQFDRPTSVFLDKAGAVYVVDQNNGRIQKWMPGDLEGITVVSGLSTPTDVFVDVQENIYVSEQGDAKVTKWNKGSTEPIIVAGGNGYGFSSNQLSSPTGIYVDAVGNVYVCDTDNNRIQKWAPGSAMGVTVAGGNDFGSAPNQLANPLEIYVDCAGTIYIADFNNNRVQRWEAGASSGITLVGSTWGELNGPIGVFMDSSHTLYVAEFYNHRVQRFISPIVVTYTPVVAGDYTATILFNGGSTISNTITISALKSPILPPDTMVCTMSSIVLNPFLSFKDYLWNDGSVNKSIEVNKPGLYWVEVTDNSACKGRDSIIIANKDCISEFYVPTGFTPNADGKNDLFMPLGSEGVKTIDFRIYNRWGQEVFHTRQVNYGWDGRFSGLPQPIGAYVWVCTYQLQNEPVRTKKGNFILIR